MGLDSALWARFLGSPIPPEMEQEIPTWSLEEWTTFLKLRATDLLASVSKETASEKSEGFPIHNTLSDEIIESIYRHLPPQPWPSGTHKKISEQLNLPLKTIREAISELIRRGRAYNQVNGVVLIPAAIEAIEASTDGESDQTQQ